MNEIGRPGQSGFGSVFAFLLRGLDAGAVSNGRSSRLPKRGEREIGQVARTFEFKNPRQTFFFVFTQWDCQELQVSLDRMCMLASLHAMHTLPSLLHRDAYASTYFMQGPTQLLRA